MTRTKKKKIVLTGGPGAGKTAVLEIVRKQFCDKVAIIPEAATILFSGGFLRSDSILAIEASQRLIFHIQKELENLMEEESSAEFILCDRGSLDGLAYWPGAENSFWNQVNSTKEIELSSYDLVIHLKTPIADHYNNINPIRIESPAEALLLDNKTLEVWKDHPNLFIIESYPEFLKKINKFMEIINTKIPEACMELKGKL